MEKYSDNFYNRISELLQLARKNAIQAVNHTMVEVYFKIGKLIVEEEQKGNPKAGYVTNLINGLSKKLSNEFGMGFSTTNLKQMRSFYLTYSKGQKEMEYP